MFERIRVECKREACETQRSEFLKGLAEKVRQSGFQKGEKDPFMLGQRVMKVEDCVKSLLHFLNEGSAVTMNRGECFLQQSADGMLTDERDQLSEQEAGTGLIAPNSVLVVEKLKELQSLIHKGGKEVREMLGACDGIQANASYPNHLPNYPSVGVLHTRLGHRCLSFPPQN